MPAVTSRTYGASRRAARATVTTSRFRSFTRNRSISTVDPDGAFQEALRLVERERAHRMASDLSDLIAGGDRRSLPPATLRPPRRPG